MIETIKTKIMLLIGKKTEEADKWNGMLCPKIKRKVDVNIKDSLRRCVDCKNVRKSFGSVSCSICLETVTDNGDRSWTKV
ncbi:hypothetical protein V6Z12_A09G033700 [Gossypium hirsutum]